MQRIIVIESSNKERELQRLLTVAGRKIFELEGRLAEMEELVFEQRLQIENLRKKKSILDLFA